MDTTPEESPEDRRRRLAMERRARRDRMIANQEFLTDRTAFLGRQFGTAPGSFGGTPRQSVFGALRSSVASLSGRSGSRLPNVGRGLFG